MSDHCGAGDDESRQNGDHKPPPSASSSALPCLIKELAETPSAQIRRGDSIRHRHDEATIASTIRDVESVSARWRYRLRRWIMLTSSLGR